MEFRDDIGVDDPFYVPHPHANIPELDTPARNHEDSSEQQSLHQSTASCVFTSHPDSDPICVRDPPELTADFSDNSDDHYVGSDGQRHVDTSIGEDGESKDGVYYIVDSSDPDAPRTNIGILQSDNMGEAGQAMRAYLNQNLPASARRDDKGFHLDIFDIVPVHQLAGCQAKLWRDVPLARGIHAFKPPLEKPPYNESHSKIANVVTDIVQDLSRNYVFVVRPFGYFFAPCDHPLCTRNNTTQASPHNDGTEDDTPPQQKSFLSLEPYVGWETLRCAPDCDFVGDKILVFTRDDDIKIKGFTLRKVMPKGLKFCVGCLEDLWNQRHTVGFIPPTAEEQDALSATSSLHSSFAATTVSSPESRSTSKHTPQRRSYVNNQAQQDQPALSTSTAVPVPPNRSPLSGGEASSKCIPQQRTQVKTDQALLERPPFEPLATLTQPPIYASWNEAGNLYRNGGASSSSEHSSGLKNGLDGMRDPRIYRPSYLPTISNEDQSKPDDRSMGLDGTIDSTDRSQPLFPILPDSQETVGRDAAIQLAPSFVTARQDRPALAPTREVSQLSYSSQFNPVNAFPKPSAFTAVPTVPQYLLPAFVPTNYTSPYPPQPPISNPQSRRALRGGVTRTEIRNAAARIGQMVYDSERDFVQQYHRKSTPARGTTRAPITPPRTTVVLLPPNSISPPVRPNLSPALSCSPSPIANLPIRLRAPAFPPAMKGPSFSSLVEATRKQRYDDITARLQKQRETDRWLAGEKRRVEDAKRKVSAELKKKRAALAAAKEPLTMRDQSPDEQPPVDREAEEIGFWSSEQLEAHLAAKLEETDKAWAKTLAARRMGESDFESFRRTYGKHKLTYCSCGRGDDGQPMVECANPDCEVGVYHVACLHASERKAVEIQEENNSALALQRRQRRREELEDRGEVKEGRRVRESRKWTCRACEMEIAQAKKRELRQKAIEKKQAEQDLWEAREAREEERMRMEEAEVRGMHQIMHVMQPEESVQDGDGFIMDEGF
ncbi:hypothetical protein BU16DRAFT_109252 [Lophium mytilinum]|uniref:Zinc finger PHD-type domain-containing protein n=1 Tax=Lophium mytilinum TaxID=390894 RepID=A0A6A6QK16_9PEZI|nr:hypothetical protein BU16DRAFT_109252 [Lophium mytilinum]